MATDKKTDGKFVEKGSGLIIQRKGEKPSQVATKK